MSAQPDVVVVDRTTVDVVETSADTIVVQEQTAPDVVEVGISGPQGPPGTPGPAGAGFQYVHDQATPATVWTVVHNLNGYPGGVSVVDSAGTEVEMDVEYLDANTIRLTSAAPFGGQAFIS